MDEIRTWWEWLDDEWKHIFAAALSHYAPQPPTDEELRRLVDLDELHCGASGITDLEPLRMLRHLGALVPRK